MNIIKNERYKESYVEETLDNGLKVILWHKPDFEKSYFMMATPLGAMDLKQVDETGKTYDFPAGIAHFLEHKMFEDEGMDVMDQFSSMGANVNAFTSYNETAYYFTTSGDPIPPLHLLLDFVQKLNISSESVEKEKGIIVQELNMYQQMSDSRLLMETFSSLFVNHPLKYDVGGDSESVNSITKEQLEECYEINYHPNTMIFVGVSSIDPEILLKEIKENQSSKQFASIKKVKREECVEPKQVERTNFSFKMDVSMPKLSLAFKLSGILDPYERMKQEWCIRLMFDTALSQMSDDYQEWLDKGIINDYFGYEVDLGSDYGLIMIMSETNQKEAFIETMMKTLEKMKLEHMDKTVFERLKRRYFAQSVRSLNSFDEIAIGFMRQYFNGVDFFKAMDIIDEITLDDIHKCISNLDLSHRAIVELLPN